MINKGKDAPCNNTVGRAGESFCKITGNPQQVNFYPAIFYCPTSLIPVSSGYTVTLYIFSYVEL